MAHDQGGVFLDAILNDETLASPTDDYLILGGWTDEGGERAEVLFRGSSEDVATKLREGVARKPHHQSIYCASVEDFCAGADHLN